MTKDQLRSLYTTVRSHIGDEYAQKAAQLLVKRFLRDVPLTEGLVIAGYAPLKNEFNVMPLLAALLELGYCCALPVVVADMQPLQFRTWDGSAPLVQNRYQIQEPCSDAALVIPDIILTPLLAFDKQGVRLGYGKGFYDITLEALRKHGKRPIAIGVGYHVQLADASLPFESTDQKLDMIATEKQVVSAA